MSCTLFAVCEQENRGEHQKRSTAQYAVDDPDPDLIVCHHFTEPLFYDAGYVATAVRVLRGGLVNSTFPEL
jgi:hypothetical protein